MSNMDKAKYVLFGKLGSQASPVWQDREVRFDSPVSALQCRPGERVIDSLVSASVYSCVPHHQNSTG